MSKQIVEFCNLCGEIKPLNKEHVPPKTAFNDGRYMVLTWEEYWEKIQKGEKVAQKIRQGGHRLFSLCFDCNNETGRWYSKAFIDWCRHGMEHPQPDVYEFTHLTLYDFKPLQTIKQIATMFVALHFNHKTFREKNMGLVEFVQDQYTNRLDSRYRIYTYFVAKGPLRLTPFVTTFNTMTGKYLNGMEISYPPFGYVITFDSEPEEKRLCEITGFYRYAYNKDAEIRLPLYVLPTHYPIIQDYRFHSRVDDKGGDIKYILNLDFDPLASIRAREK